MGWTALRIWGALSSAAVTAVGLALNANGVGGLNWSWTALIAFVVFGGFVIWGWGNSEWKSYRESQTEGVLSHLAVLRTAGIAFQNYGMHEIEKESEITPWWDNTVTPWQNAVETVMRKRHKADPYNWRDIGTFTPRSFEGVRFSELNQRLTMLVIRLEKLERYINDRTK